MKNVVESIWSSLNKIIQAKLSMEVCEGVVCHHPERGEGGTRVEDSKVGQVVHWLDMIVLLFFCEEHNCFAVYGFLELLIL